MTCRRHAARIVTISLVALHAIAAHADLNLAVEANPDPIEPSEMLEVQITVSSTAASGDLTLRMIWPADLQGTPIVTGGGTCPLGSCQAGEFLTWNLGPLGPGASIAVGFDEFVTSIATDGTLIPLDFELLEGASTVATLFRTVEVQTNSPLELAVDPLTDPVAPSGTLVYEIVYGNAGASSAENVELAFPLPPGTQFQAATGGGVFAGGTVSWNLGSLPAHSGDRQRVTVDVDPLAGGTLLAVDAATLSGDIAFEAHQSRAMAVSRVDNQTLALDVELNPDPVAASEMLDAQILVSNPGVSTSGSLTLRLLWPQDVGATPIVTGGGTCPLGSCQAGEFLTWNLGPLGPGASIAVGFDEFVTSIAVSGALIPFEFELLEGGAPARNRSHTVLVRTNSPLELAVDPLTDPVASDGMLIYQLTYGNSSATTAENAELTFPMPTGTTFLSATGGELIDAPGLGDTVRWDLGSLPAHGGGRQLVTVQVNAPVPGHLVVDAATISGEFVFVPQSTRARAVSKVGVSLLQLAASFGPNPISPSEVLSGQLEVTNTGPGTTGVLTLRLLWPEDLNATPVVTGGGTCPLGSCQAGEFLTWDLGILGPGANLSVEFEETVTSIAEDGNLIPLEVELLEGSFPARNVSDTVLVNPFSDNDGDGLGDVLDEDDDNDGMPDWWELLHGLNPFDPSDADEDPDGDGMTNLEEFLAGTDPNAHVLEFFDGFESVMEHRTSASNGRVS